MPTQEERLTALERSQIDTNKNMTILLGIVSEQQKDISEMNENISGMSVDINDMKGDIARMRTDMHSIAATLKQILDRLPPAQG